MVKDYKFYLVHMLKDIKEAELFSLGYDFEKFSKSSLVQNAIFKKLENIGEGAGYLPPEVRAKNPEIPWQTINLETIWDIVKNDLPPLKKAVKDLLK